MEAIGSIYSAFHRYTTTTTTFLELSEVNNNNLVQIEMRLTASVLL